MKQKGVVPYDDAGVVARIKAMNQANGRGDAVVTQSYLRLEQPLATQTNVNFQVLANQGSANVTEKRLQITDQFTITGLAMFIYKAGAATTATQSEISQSILRTYPSAQVFTGVGEAVAFMSLYNSYLTVKVDGTVYIDSLDLMRFYRVGTSQQNVGSTAANNIPVQRDEWNETNFGFAKVAPTITLSGVGKNEIGIQLPASTNLSGTSSQNFVVCYLRGYLSQNASSVAR